MFQRQQSLLAMGHDILLHGRNESKLEKVTEDLSGLVGGGRIESYVADLASISEVEKLASAVAYKNNKLDVLINNAGVCFATKTVTDDGLDVRFAVNTIAPYLLTIKLLPLLGSSSRVINLSSAAQAPVDPEALAGRNILSSDGTVYAQSKLALTMWTCDLVLSIGNDGHDLRITAEIVCRASLSEEFSAASGEYFDNDIGHFTDPHSYALDPQNCNEIVGVIESLLAKIIQ